MTDQREDTTHRRHVPGVERVFEEHCKKNSIVCPTAEIVSHVVSTAEALMID